VSIKPKERRQKIKKVEEALQKSSELKKRMKRLHHVMDTWSSRSEYFDSLLEDGFIGTDEFDRLQERVTPLLAMAEEDLLFQNELLESQLDLLNALSKEINNK